MRPSKARSVSLATAAMSAMSAVAWAETQPSAPLSDPQSPAPKPGCLRHEGPSPAKPQHPELLSGYRARPAWKVAGVDWAAGPSGDVPLKDPQMLKGPGINIDLTSRIMRIDNISGLIIDGYDFSRLRLGLWLVNSPNTTIINSNFAFDPLERRMTGIYADEKSRNLYVGCNAIDGAKTASSLIYALGPNVTVEGNWMTNPAQHFLEVTGGGDIAYRYNLMEQGGHALGAHLNYLQLGAARYSSYSVLYNTVYQTPQVAGGEIFQIQMYGQGGLVVDPEIAWNTIIALPEAERKAVSWAVHTAHEPSVLGGRVHHNYFDPEGMYGPIYPVADGVKNPTFSDNVNMRTGERFPDPVTATPAPNTSGQKF